MCVSAPKVFLVQASILMCRHVSVHLFVSVCVCVSEREIGSVCVRERECVFVCV